MNFYSKLPKGQATPRVSGIKGRFFTGKNASGGPLVVLIVSLFGIGYTLDYNSESLLLHPSALEVLMSTRSASEYVHASFVRTIAQPFLEHHKNHTH